MIARLRGCFFCLLFFASAITTACESGPPPQTVTLPGGTVVMIESTVPFGTTTGERILQLKYQTDVPIDNPTELRAQAEEVWECFRFEVELSGYWMHVGDPRAVIASEAVLKEAVLTEAAKDNANG